MQLLLLGPQPPTSSQGAQLSAERPMGRPRSGQLHVGSVDGDRSDWPNRTNHRNSCRPGNGASGSWPCRHLTHAAEGHPRSSLRHAGNRDKRHGLSATRRLAFTALGAHFAEQETTQSAGAVGSLSIALLSSGIVHIPDGPKKSKELEQKTAPQATSAKASSTGASSCDLRKNLKSFPTRPEQGFPDAYAR